MTDISSIEQGFSYTTAPKASSGTTKLLDQMYSTVQNQAGSFTTYETDGTYAADVRREKIQRNDKESGYLKPENNMDAYKMLSASPQMSASGDKFLFASTPYGNIKIFYSAIA